MPQAGIHPKYVAATVTCACGQSYSTASTRGTFNVEICGACHPFYTGKQRSLDTTGRIERFTKRYAKNNPPVAAAATEPEKA